jgi:hypothetical protein
MIFASSPDLSESMPTQKATVYFTCQPDVKAALQEWADEEGRSLSNLVERLVQTALAEKKKQNKESED